VKVRLDFRFVYLLHINKKLTKCHCHGTCHGTCHGFPKNNLLRRDLPLRRQLAPCSCSLSLSRSRRPCFHIRRRCPQSMILIFFNSIARLHFYMLRFDILSTSTHRYARFLDIPLLTLDLSSFFWWPFTVFVNRLSNFICYYYRFFLGMTRCEVQVTMVFLLGNGSLLPIRRCPCLSMVVH
jgi:hypothetical protein